MAAKKRLRDEVVEALRKELNTCKGKWQQLSKLTERKLSYRWLVAFAGDEIKEPSFAKVRLLGQYLGVRVTTEPCGHFLKFKPE